jgi:hypothetical protein
MSPISGEMNSKEQVAYSKEITQNFFTEIRCFNFRAIIIKQACASLSGSTYIMFSAVNETSSLQYLACYLIEQAVENQVYLTS